MYPVALLVFLSVLFYAIQFAGSPLMFMDIPSLIIIVFITLPMLLASGLWKDFKRAFKVVMFKTVVCTKLELQCSLEAIKLTMKLLIFSGLFGSLIGLISMLAFLNDPKAIGPNCAVMLLTILYSLFGSFIFMPIQAKLKVLILSYSDEK